MSKQEFLNRLDHLLSDISPEERADALTFYENYFEDAGPENEANVISELGSPEKVAVSIKKDLTRASGSFGEQGFCQAEDPATEDPFTAGQSTADQGNGNASNNFRYQSYQDNDYNRSYTDHTGQPKASLSERIKRKLNEWQFYREHRTFCIVMFIAILIFTCPAWGSVLGGILGVVFGILGILVGIIATCFALAIAGVVTGITLIVIGIMTLAATIGPGLFLIGLGLFCLAFGTLFTLASGELCFRFIPWCYRNICDLINRSRQSIGGAAA
ncbi:MAG: DUF1700 domain-containing protein [Lachnospiraceae bacterium]